MISVGVVIIILRGGLGCVLVLVVFSSFFLLYDLAC